MGLRKGAVLRNFIAQPYLCMVDWLGWFLVITTCTVTDYVPKSTSYRSAKGLRGRDKQEAESLLA